MTKKTKVPIHDVFVDSIGGTTTLSCEALQIKTIEYPFAELNAEGIKNCILKYKFLTEKDVNFNLNIIDNRPEPVDYNKQRAKESKEFKKNNNSMKTPKR